MDRDPKRNLFQLFSLVVFGIVGAGIGWTATNDRPELAAAIGGVLGIVVGTFLSGLALMCVPPADIKLTPAEFHSRLVQRRQKSRGRRRQLGFLIAVFVFFMTTQLVVWDRFKNDGSDFAWFITVLWPVCIFTTNVYAHALAFSLRDWTCPACQKPIPLLDDECENCSFSLVASTGLRRDTPG